MMTKNRAKNSPQQSSTQTTHNPNTPKSSSPYSLYSYLLVPSLTLPPPHTLLIFELLLRHPSTCPLTYKDHIEQLITKSYNAFWPCNPPQLKKHPLFHSPPSLSLHYLYLIQWGLTWVTGVEYQKEHHQSLRSN